MEGRVTKLVDPRIATKWTTRSLVELLAIVAMAAIVVTLGVVQYRWAGQISRTEQERMQSALATGVRTFSQEFSYDFQQLCESFQFQMEGPASTLEARLLSQYENWSRISSTPNLVTRVHVWRAAEPRAEYLASYEENTRRFVEREWPERFDSLRQFMNQEFAKLPGHIPGREAYYHPWTLVEETPALIRPLFQLVSQEEVEPAGFLIVELSGDFLSKLFLPELVERNFGGSTQPGFEIVVRSAAEPFQVIYSSVPAASGSFLSPDATVNLVELVDMELRRRGGPGLQPSEPGREWLMLAQHPAGSVEMAVAALRRRNLAISFGLLAVLATGMALIFEVARRAKRMASQQMEFVAGVSHELCTPLAVINSAAENLMDGVVEGPSEIKEYGGMIRDQGRRLEQLVDEVLLFAAGRSERTGYDLRPVEIGPIVKHSLASAEPMLRDAGFTVEQECAVALPPVLADPAAVGMCMENLFSNAVKYAGASQWIAVGARAVPAGAPTEVQISVADRGAGIPAKDLPHIFEPFYRVQSAREGQIRGVGLGLYLVKRAMEGMGGQVSVSSEVGRGSCFTLHFPVARSAERPEGETISADAKRNVLQPTG
jgi:signal transduction histidine kinase